MYSNQYLISNLGAFWGLFAKTRFFKLLINNRKNRLIESSSVLASFWYLRDIPLAIAS